MSIVPVISFDNVCYKYDGDEIFQIDHISFDVFQGEVIGLLGPNGAGKSTILNLIYEILKPLSGAITISKLEKDKYISYLPQFSTLFNKLTIEENLLTVCNLFNIDSSTIEEQMDSIIKKLNLFSSRNKLFEELSEGQKRILNFLIMLIPNSPILLLDEPYNSLDIKNQDLINKKIKKLKEKNTTVLISSHIFEPMKDICDRYMIFDKGKLIGLYDKSSIIEKDIYTLLKEKILK